jgi:hypothetical protein
MKMITRTMSKCKPTPQVCTKATKKTRFVNMQMDEQMMSFSVTNRSFSDVLAFQPTEIFAHA